MKKSILVCVVFTLFASVLMAQIGSSCEKAKPVGTGLDIDIASAGTYWYTASVYDLPIQVMVTSTDINAEAPSVSVDFSCTGVYEEDLAKAIEEQGEEVPIQMTFNPKKIIDGKAVYTMSIGAKYRERLMQVGITRDVKAYVQVVASAGGHVTVTPDPISKQCLKGMRKLLLPDVVHVAANDVETAYLLPLCDFRHDSILFVWNGKQSPVTLWVGVDDCGFVPEEGKDHVLTSWTIAPEHELKFTSKQLNNVIDDLLHSGVYYAKIVSEEAADFRIDIVPEKPLDGIRFRYGESAPVRVEEDTMYYFPKSWNATRWTTNNSAQCRMYFSLQQDIDTSDTKTYIRYYDLDLDTLGYRYLELSDVEMAAITSSQQTEQNYIFVHVVSLSPSAIMLTPNAWLPSTCALTSYQLRSGEQIHFKSDANSKDYRFRMRYSDWKNGRIQIMGENLGRKTITMGLVRDCSVSSAVEQYVLSGTYRELKEEAPIQEIDSARMSKLAKYDAYKPTDPDGFYYWIFNHNHAACFVTFTSIPFILPTTIAEIEMLNGVEERKLLINGRLYIQRVNTIYDILGRKIDK